MSLHLSFLRSPEAAIQEKRPRRHVGSRKVRVYSRRIRDELSLLTEHSHPLLGQPPVGEDDLHALHDNREFLKDTLKNRKRATKLV